MSSFSTQILELACSAPLQTICHWSGINASTLTVKPAGNTRFLTQTLLLQLEAAAISCVQKNERQDGEDQAPTELQVFLHSSAQFGPSSMRELLVCIITYADLVAILLSCAAA